MKTIVFCLLLPLFSIAQKESHKKAKSTGYGYIAAGIMAVKKGAQFAPSIGGGVRTDHAGIGVAFYYNKDYHLSVHGDIKAYFSPESKASPFISIQPGLLLYNNSTRVGSTTVKVKGGFAFNALAGFITNSKSKKPGIYFSAGYGFYTVNTTIGTKQTSAQTGGVVINVGVKF